MGWQEEGLILQKVNQIVANQETELGDENAISQLLAALKTQIEGVQEKQTECATSIRQIKEVLVTISGLLGEMDSKLERLIVAEIPPPPVALTVTIQPNTN